MTDDPNDAPSPPLPDTAPGHVPPTDELLKRWWGLRETPAAEALEILEGALQRDGRRPFRQAEASMPRSRPVISGGRWSNPALCCSGGRRLRTTVRCLVTPGYYDPRGRGSDDA